MKRLAPLLVVLLLATVPAATAGDPGAARRLHVSLRAGGFDEQGSSAMLRKDGGPGNPIIGWKGSEQVAAGLGFEVRPGLTLDLSFARLDFDFGSDLVIAEPGAEIVTTQIATGDLDELRLAVCLDAQLLDEQPAYYLSSRRKGRGRVALAVTGAVTKAGDVVVADESRQLLGVEDVRAGTQTSVGLGVRMDYRIGRSAFTIGADLGWLWKVSGDLFVVTTTPDSSYGGAALEHEGLDFLLEVSYHF